MIEINGRPSALVMNSKSGKKFVLGVGTKGELQARASRIEYMNPGSTEFIPLSQRAVKVYQSEQKPSFLDKAKTFGKGALVGVGLAALAYGGYKLYKKGKKSGEKKETTKEEKKSEEQKSED